MSLLQNTVLVPDTLSMDIPRYPQTQQQPQPQPQSHSSSVDDDWEHKLRRYLLLLASLAATVTYAAGLDPPGGSWVESDGEHKAGDSILRTINHPRYLAFYYSNATAFAASLVVILLLLVLANKDRPLDKIHLGAWTLDLQNAHLRVLHIVMVLDLLALMVAYTAGSCREKVATIYTVALVASLSAYIGYHILEALRHKFKRRAPPARRRRSRTRPAVEVEVQSSPLPPPSEPPLTELEQLRKVLMLLSIFAATITYDAGLKPPGGFWEQTTDDGGGLLHRPGEVILKYKHGGRFAVFFFCNTTAFIASLFTVVLLLDKKLTANRMRRQQLLTLYAFVVLTTLVALVLAYAAGSCRKTASTTYTVALAAPVLVFIFVVAAAHCIREWVLSGMPDEPARAGTISPPAQPQPQQGDGHHPDDPLKAKRSLVLLLATLAATITYQAGLNPPGGVWQEYQSGSHGHNAGDPILSNTDHKRYIIFFYCNSTAFVASVVVILMVQINSLLKRNALRFAMILDLFGLLGAYIAGSSRTLIASVHLIVLAAAFLVYVTGTYLHVKSAGSQQPQINIDAAGRTRVKKRRKRLLLVAILMAAITYQAGLSPPGGFWPEHSSAGSPILEEMYPRRYQAFFYCNAMSFMASIALIILLQDDRTYQPEGIRFCGLYACMVVGMLVLMGAYAAGTARRVRTSIYVFVLVGGVIGFIALLFALFLREQRQQHQAAAASTPTPTTPGSHRQPSSANGGSTTARNDNKDDDNHLDRQSSNATNGGGTAENGGNDHNHHDHQSSNAANGGSTAENNGSGDDNHLDRQSSNAAIGGVTAENNGGNDDNHLDHQPSNAANENNGEDDNNHLNRRSSNASNGGDDNHRRRGEGHHAKRKYVMLLAMLAASVTYQAGLDPPGGVWPDGYAAGSPVLHDSNLARFHVFFYSNSSSFVASIVVIILLLQSELRNIPCQEQELHHQNVQTSDEQPRENPLLLIATNTVVVLDLVGLLVAYATGSSRTMDTSLYVIVLVIAVVIYIMVHVGLPSDVVVCVGDRRSNTQDVRAGERVNGANIELQAAQAPAESPLQQV